MDVRKELGGTKMKCDEREVLAVKVQWQTAEFQTRVKTFTSWPAQIIRHEIDRCADVLI